MSLKHKVGDLPLETIKKGYIVNGDYISCIFCGFETEKGVVYNSSSTLYDAEKFVKIHIERAHGSVFAGLLTLDKKTTGISELQCEILEKFYQQIPDEQIQKELGVGSISTIRNHRFNLKEKERQARIFMTIMELLHENDNNPHKYVPPHKGATMIDDRYKVTVDEQQKILNKYFPDGLEGQLKTFVMKEKAKIVVLRHISKRFESATNYTEKQVDSILKSVFSDHVTLRRYLIEYGLMDRTSDCTRYWLTK